MTGTPLTKTWGTSYGVKTYTDFDQISCTAAVRRTIQIGLALDYARYQSFAKVSFQGEQLEIARTRWYAAFHHDTTTLVLLDTMDHAADLYPLTWISWPRQYPGLLSK